MINGIRFGKYHSYDDFGLILSSVHIPPANPKTNYVDIPGADGQLDLTEALGCVRYQMREAEFVFTTKPGYDIELTKRLVSNALNGLYCDIIVEKDPEYYWQGRLTVSAYGYEYPVDKITIKATLKPYKLKHNLTVASISNIPYGSSFATSVFCSNDCMPTKPTFINESSNRAIVINLNGYTQTLGPNKIVSYDDVIFSKGINTVKVHTLTTTPESKPLIIKYQEGSL